MHLQALIALKNLLLLRTTKAQVLKELEARAAEMGANAIIGVRIDFDPLGGDGNNMLLVTVTGTAVVVR